jgi:hypothetical protein
MNTNNHLKKRMMKTIGLALLVGAMMAITGCGNNSKNGNDQSTTETDATTVDTSSMDTSATDTTKADTATAKPGGTGDTTQTAFPSSRKSNTQ